MRKLWTDRAWDEYLTWQEENKKLLRKLNKLIKDIERSPYDGLGKPELLKHDLSGWWSRQIDEPNRIVYRIKDGNLEISQCKGHYSN